MQRRQREVGQTMQIGPEQLWNENTDYPLGPKSRLFFEASEMDFKRTKRHAKRLEGLTIQDETWQSAPGGSTCWTLNFTFEGHTFCIDSNDHAATALFFVGDRDCADDVLLLVLNHFDRDTPLLHVG